MHGSHTALLLLIALAKKEISYVSTSQVWSITLLLPERILPTPTAKLNKKAENAKTFGYIFIIRR